MNKYIDAEKLKSIIKVQIKGRKEWMKDIDRSDRQDQLWSDLNGEDMSILQIINSLQQEQPDFPTTDEQMKEFLATHPKIKVPEKYKTPDWLIKKQKQPEVDLEKAARHVYESWMGGTMDDVRRDMVELGKVINARKEE